MKVSGFARSVFVFAWVSGFAGPAGWAQKMPASGAAANKIALKKLVDGSHRISPGVRRHLSRGMQTYLLYAENAVSAMLPRSGVLAEKLARKQKHSAWTPWDVIPVSNASLDPGGRGYTQNTTSSAWCGNAVVVGYEDSGALLRTDPNNAFGVPLSLDGVSYSTDSGKNFTDVGFVNPGTFSANALLPEPSVACSSATHFYYGSILNTTTPDGFNPIIGPSISFSTDGGKSWGQPLQIVSLDGSTQLADQPWLAVDPTNAERMYVSYTQIDFPGCVSIAVVRSGDGGKTWSAPTFLDQECTPTQTGASQNAVAGSRIVVGPDARVHVVYEFFPGFNPDVTQNNVIRYVSSGNHGTTFSKPTKVGELVPSGDGNDILNGNMVVDEYPQIAVDRSNKPSRGTIYVTYPDGRNRIIANRNTATGTYAYPDIFLAKSTNAGRSFAVLGAVSPVARNFAGIGRDQFLPGVAVDKDGEVAVCYYDRRDDRSDLRVDRFCSLSRNQGRSWTNYQASHQNWLPMPDLDPLSPTGGRISEYDALTSDFLARGDGFFGAFIVEISGNQNVVATKF
jgi:hypothetical protein